MASNKIQVSSQSSNEGFEKHHQALVTGLKSHLKVVVQEAPGELLGTELKSRLLDETVDLTQRIKELLGEVKKASSNHELFFQFVSILTSVGLCELANKLRDEYWSLRPPHERDTASNEEGEAQSVPVNSNSLTCTEISYTNEELWANYSFSPHQESLVPCITEQPSGTPASLEPNVASSFSSVAETRLDTVVLQSPPLSGFMAPHEENTSPTGNDEPVFGQVRVVSTLRSNNSRHTHTFSCYIFKTVCHNFSDVTYYV